MTIQQILVNIKGYTEPDADKLIKDAKEQIQKHIDNNEVDELLWLLLTPY